VESLTKDLTLKAYKSDLPKNRTGPAPKTLGHMSQIINNVYIENHKIKASQCKDKPCANS